MTVTSERDYTRELPIDAPRDRAFAALTTLEGLAGWWTPIVSGTPTAGGDVTFGFDGLDETVVMHVEDSTSPSAVRWSCLRHSGHPEWEGTTVVFELADRDARGCVLRFRHEGLNPRLDCYLVCERGWEHFLASLAGYAETGRGMPFG